MVQPIRTSQGCSSGCSLGSFQTDTINMRADSGCFLLQSLLAWIFNRQKIFRARSVNTYVNEQYLIRLFKQTGVQ
jgi:hypothetical protein